MKRFEFLLDLIAGITVYAENELLARQQVYDLLAEGQDIELPRADLFVKLEPDTEVKLEQVSEGGDPFDESIEDKFATAGINVINNDELQRLIDEDPFKEIAGSPTADDDYRRVGPVNPTYIAGMGEIPAPTSVAGIGALAKLNELIDAEVTEVLARYHERIHEAHQACAEESERAKARAEEKKALAKLLLEKPIGNPDSDPKVIHWPVVSGYPYYPGITAVERDTIVAALRLWQSVLTGDVHLDEDRMGYLDDIATDMGAHTAQTADEVDNLIDRLNR